MRYSVSNTAEYGDLTRGPVVIDAKTKERMKGILTDIQSGAFAKEWMAEAAAGLPKFKALAEAGKKHQIEAVGAAVARHDAVDEEGAGSLRINCRRRFKSIGK